MRFLKTPSPYRKLSSGKGSSLRPFIRGEPISGGGGTFGVVTGQRAWSTSANVISYPAGTQEGDLLWLFWVTANDQSARDPGTPSGWISRYAYNYLGHHRIYTRVAGVEASVTIPVTSSEADIVWSLVRVPPTVGINTSTPWAFANQNAAIDNSTTISTPTRAANTRRRFALFSSFNDSVMAASSIDPRLEVIANVKHDGPPQGVIRRPWLIVGWNPILETLDTGFGITWDTNTYKVATQIEVIDE